jgi:hypothetical protein
MKSEVKDSFQDPEEYTIIITPPDRNTVNLYRIYRDDLSLLLLTSSLCPPPWPPGAVPPPPSPPVKRNQ